MFAKSQQMELLNSETEDYKVVWREFHERLKLLFLQKF